METKTGKSSRSDLGRCSRAGRAERDLEVSEPALLIGLMLESILIIGDVQDL